MTIDQRTLLQIKADPLYQRVKALEDQGKERLARAESHSAALKAALADHKALQADAWAAIQRADTQTTGRLLEVLDGLLAWIDRTVAQQKRELAASMRLKDEAAVLRGCLMVMHSDDIDSEGRH